jgi:hypothetical protein
MEKKLKVTIGRNTQKASRIVRTAQIAGVSERMVRYVLAGERENETIMEIYMSLYENELQLDSALAQHVAKIVPLN